MKRLFLMTVMFLSCLLGYSLADTVLPISVRPFYNLPDTTLIVVWDSSAHSTIPNEIILELQRYFFTHLRNKIPKLKMKEIFSENTTDNVEFASFIGGLSIEICAFNYDTEHYTGFISLNLLRPVELLDLKNLSLTWDTAYRTAYKTLGFNGLIAPVPVWHKLIIFQNHRLPRLKEDMDSLIDEFAYDYIQAQDYFEKEQSLP